MKQTEIGLIPDDWEVNRIGNVSEIFGRIGFRGYTVEDLVDEGFGAITLSPSNIQNGRMDFSNCSYISWKKYDESPEIKIANGDILLVKTGSTYGKSAIVKNLTKKATINPQFVVIKKTKCNNELLGYLIQTPTVQEQIEASIVGGAIPTLSQKQIASFKIPLSKSLAEQQRIAKALSDVDALISTTEKLIQKKKNIKQGTMQNLLTGKKRLPGFAKSTNYKQSELGPIPEDWEVKKIIDICDNYSYGVGAEAIQYDGRNQYIRITDIDDESRAFSPDPVTSPSYISENCYVNNGDILIARTGNSVGKSYHYSPKNGKLIFAGFLMRIHVTSANSKFVFYNTLSTHYNNWITSESMRSGQPGINLEQIKQYIIALPSKEEQTAIANVLSSMDKEIEILNTKLEKYRNLKTAMMQQLLTGKIRLIK